MKIKIAYRNLDSDASCCTSVHDWTRFSDIVVDLVEWTCIQYVWCLHIIFLSSIDTPWPNQQNICLGITLKCEYQSYVSFRRPEKLNCKQGGCVWTSGGADHHCAVGKIKFLKRDKCWMCGPFHSTRFPNGALFSLRECHLLTSCREGLYVSISMSLEDKGGTKEVFFYPFLWCHLMVRVKWCFLGHYVI